MTTQQVRKRKHSRRYEETARLIDRSRVYDVDEAIGLMKQLATTKFDETVELHIRTGSDPRHSDQIVRSVAQLPHGTGKPVRVVAFVQGDAANAAREAGADYIGDDDLIARIQEGWTDFDAAIATPEMMGRIGRLGRVLGRRGLMPNPRTGTVVNPQDVARAVQEAKRGRVEFRMDRTANIHIPIGKVSFEESRLKANLAAAMDAVVKAQPSGVKGRFIRSVHVATSMGPSIQLDPNQVTGLRVE